MYSSMIRRASSAREGLRGLSEGVSSGGFMTGMLQGARHRTLSQINGSPFAYRAPFQIDPASRLQTARL
jgi:hypothetical protein